MSVKKTKENAEKDLNHANENAEIHRQTEINIGAEIDANTPASTQEPVTDSEPELQPENPPQQNNQSGFGGSTVDDVMNGMGEKDIDGVPFNPAIHTLKEDGTKSKTKNGKWRKKSGRKSDDQKTAETAQSQNKFTEPPPPSTLQMLLTTMQVASLTFVSIAGKEWELKEQEQKTLADVYARYVHYRGWDEFMTPEAVVIGVTLSVLGPRIMPKIISMFSPKKRKMVHAHINIGPNIKRENDGSQSNGQSNTIDPENPFGGLG